MGRSPRGSAGLLQPEVVSNRSPASRPDSDCGPMPQLRKSRFESSQNQEDRRSGLASHWSKREPYRRNPESAPHQSVRTYEIAAPSVRWPLKNFRDHATQLQVPRRVS